jgi:hypothetical protein
VTHPIFLDENGVRITQATLEVKGQVYEFAKIISVRVQRRAAIGIPGLAKFELIVDAGKGEQIVYETTDEKFMGRVLNAMDAAAKEKRVK